MIRTWGRILLRAMSEIDQIQMYLPVILTPKVFPKHDGISRFEKRFKRYYGDINPLGVHRNMRGCILEVNSERLGWLSTACLFKTLLILT